MPAHRRPIPAGTKRCRRTGENPMNAIRSSDSSIRQQLLSDTFALQKHIRNGLQQQAGAAGSLFHESIHPSQASAVLFLLGCGCLPGKEAAAEPCLILNKRSAKVRQPGDLCCPGGSIAPTLDPLLARLLRLPASPLFRWEHWRQWRTHRPRQSRQLSLLFATGLRESVEEMRLNPLGVKLLGPLPPENLVMFQRTIYPLVCWVSGQKTFYPNWEVERIVSIPIRELLEPSRYARFRLRIEVSAASARVNGTRDFPCYLHRRDGRTERLWGATFRIAMKFLETTFAFQPPPLESLPTVEGEIDENYVNPNSQTWSESKHS